MATSEVRPAPAAPTFFERLENAARELIWCALVLVAIGAAAWIYLLHNLDDQIRVAVQRHIQADLEGSPLVVTIKSARRVPGEGIEARGITLRHRQHGEPLLDVDELHLKCGTDLQDLINEEIHVRQVVMRRPRLYVNRSADGTYNLAAFAGWKRPAQRKNHRDCPVRIEDGTVILSCATSASAKPLELRQIFGELIPSDPTKQQPMHMDLRCGGAYCEELRVACDFDAESQSLSFSGKTTGLRFSRELLDTLPPECGERLLPLASLEGRTQVRFSAQRAGADEPWHFEVNGELADGRWDDRRLPTPITELECKFELSDTGGKLKRLAGRSGDATFELALSWDGYTVDSPLDLTAKVRQFDLTRAWVELLPMEARTEWEKLAPLGTFDADVDLKYDGQHWTPNVTLRCQDVALTYERFPYRLTGANGVWVFRDGVLRTKGFQALAKGRPVVLDVEMRDPGPDFVGYIALGIDQPVPLDEDLLAALPDKSRAIVRSLQPRGEWTAHGRFERREPHAPLERSLDIEVHRGAIQYTGFQYPLAGIRGSLRLRGDQWDIVELTGTNDSAYVVARGGWNADATGSVDFRLDFEATDVPLEEELKNALSPAGQRLWSSIQPRGTLDYLTVGIRHPRGASRWSVEVFGQKRPATQSGDGRYITIRPTWTPFSLDNLVGSVRYHDGRVEFEGLRAEHGRTSFQASGICQLGADGGWVADLSRVSVDRWTLDRETLAGLPNPWSSSLARLNWNGPINAEGALKVAASAQPNDPVQANWDVRLDVENGSMRCGVPIDQIRGEVRLTGHGDSRAMLTQGELSIDSAMCQGVQVTRIRGPFWLTPQRLVFGDTRADRKRMDQPPRQVTAQIFDGVVSTDAVVFLGEELSFDLQTDVQNVDLRLLSREALPKKRDVSGRAFAALHLSGTSRGALTWRGEGKVTCRDGDFYEVPVLVAMVKPTRPRGNEGMAFNLSDVDFHIAGDRIYFDRIDLKGDTMTLKGRGEMTLDRVVDLQFFSVMGRDEIRVPVIGPMLNEASRQIMEVHVTGPLEEPVVDRKVVPVINEALQKMFPELSQRAPERKLIPNRVLGPGQLFPGAGSR